MMQVNAGKGRANPGQPQDNVGTRITWGYVLDNLRITSGYDPYNFAIFSGIKNSGHILALKPFQLA